MTPPGRTPESLDRVRRAVTAALYDIDVAQARGVRMYLDLDIVLPVVVGDLYDADSGELANSDRGRIGALWSSGWTPSGYLLRSHMVELHRRLFRGMGGRFVQELPGWLFEYVRRSDVEQLVKQAQSATTPQREKDFRNSLRDFALPSFVECEFHRLSWAARLNELSRTRRLRLDAGGDEIKKLAGDPRVDYVESKFAELDERERFTRSNYYDAIAIVSLSRFVQTSTENPGAAAVRFCTTTPSMLKLCERDATIRNLLRVPVIPALQRESDDKNGHAVDHAGTVLRSSLYFEILALLRERLEGDSWQRRQSRTVDDLAQSVMDLYKPTGASPDTAAVRESMASHVWKSRTDLFIEHIWLSDSGPIKNAATRDTTDVHRGLQRIHTLAAKGRQDIVADARAGVDQLRSLVGHEPQQQSWMLRFFNRLPLNRPPLTAALRPTIDLALVRWIASVPAQVEQSLTALCTDLVDEDRSKQRSACSTLAEKIVRLVSGNEWTGDFVIEVVGALLFMEAYEEIEQFILDLERRWGCDVIQPGLQLACKAALLKRGLQSESDIENTARDAMHIVRSARHGRHVNLGASYVLYLAWDSLVRQRTKNRHLLEQCVSDSVSCALAIIDQGGNDATRAFAVDHYCFVWACIVAAGSDKVQYRGGPHWLIKVPNLKPRPELRQELISCKTGPWWNYRFADTILFSELMDVLEELRRSDAKVDHRTLSTRVRRIREELQTLVTAGAGKETAEHVLVAAELLNHLE